MTVPPSFGNVSNFNLVGKPRLIAFSIAASIFLVLGLLSSITDTFFLPPLDLSTHMPQDVIINFLLRDPVSYLIIFLSGLTVLITNDFQFGSRKRMTFSSFLLMTGSVLTLLASYSSPFSVFILLSLESFSLPVSFIAILYPLIQSVIIFSLILVPITALGFEMFPRKGRQILAFGLLMFLFSALLPFAMQNLLFLESGAILSISSVFGVSYFVVFTLPVYLQSASYFILLVPLLQHFHHIRQLNLLNATSTP